MGSALRRLVVEYKGKFLSDSKKISGTGRRTKKVTDKLHNYYGMAIRSNVGDLRGMMMAVQATLHHMTSTDARPVHHMCPEGENSWCSRLSRSVYKESSSAKLLKKACRRKRKGNEDNNEAREGGKMYAAGEFGEHGLDVTICPSCKKRRM